MRGTGLRLLTWSKRPSNVLNTWLLHSVTMHYKYFEYLGIKSASWIELNSVSNRSLCHCARPSVLVDPAGLVANIRLDNLKLGNSFGL